MNRRNFLSLFSAGIAGIALEQAIPLQKPQLPGIVRMSPWIGADS